MMKLLIMQSSPLPCYIVPLRSKYPPQHPILQHPDPVIGFHPCKLIGRRANLECKFEPQLGRHLPTPCESKFIPLYMGLVI